MSDPALPSFRYRLEQQPPHTSCGGLVRGASVRQFPVSQGIARASMRLLPGCLRELHWHTTAAELGYVVFRSLEQERNQANKTRKGGTEVMKISKRIISNMLVSAVALAAMSLSVFAQGPAGKPNILFIMGDDIGWMQPSIYHQGLMVGEHRTSIALARKARSSPTTTQSRAARRGGTHSSPECIRCAPA